MTRYKYLRRVQPCCCNSARRLISDAKHDNYHNVTGSPPVARSSHTRPTRLRHIRASPRLLRSQVPPSTRAEAGVPQIQRSPQPVARFQAVWRPHVDPDSQNYFAADFGLSCRVLEVCHAPASQLGRLLPLAMPRPQGPPVHGTRYPSEAARLPRYGHRGSGRLDSRADGWPPERGRRGRQAPHR